VLLPFRRVFLESQETNLQTIPVPILPHNPKAITQYRATKMQPFNGSRNFNGNVKFNGSGPSNGNGPCNGPSGGNGPVNKNGPFNINGPSNGNGPSGGNVPSNRNGSINRNGPFNKNGFSNSNDPHSINGPPNFNGPYNGNGPINSNGPSNVNPSSPEVLLHLLQQKCAMLLQKDTEMSQKIALLEAGQSRLENEVEYLKNPSAIAVETRSNIAGLEIRMDDSEMKGKFRGSLTGDLLALVLCGKGELLRGK
jgi:hypothetical protein